MYYRYICLRPVIVEQFCSIHPDRLRMFCRMQPTSRHPTDERVEAERELRVMVLDHRHLLLDLNIDTQLLVDFSLEASFSTFASFDLSSGEFPLQRKLHRRRSLADQDHILMSDNGAGHL